jgi:hypothetical protein
MGRVSGRRPGRLRTEREQRAWQAAEEIGFGTDAAANARRMWLVVSTTRGAIFNKRKRSVLHTAAYWLMLTVANSAMANSRALEIASRARAAVWRSPIKSVSIEGQLCPMQL